MTLPRGAWLLHPGRGGYQRVSGQINVVKNTGYDERFEGFLRSRRRLVNYH